MRSAVSIYPPLLGIALTALIGCGPGKGDVSGTVTFQKAPAAGATITFYDEANGVFSAEVKEDGRYEVKNVTAGKAKITVVPPLAIAMAGQTVPKALPINPKYADKEKSGLTYEVKSGQQTHPIELE